MLVSDGRSQHHDCPPFFGTLIERLNVRVSFPPTSWWWRSHGQEDKAGVLFRMHAALRPCAVPHQRRRIQTEVGGALCQRRRFKARRLFEARKKKLQLPYTSAPLPAIPAPTDSLLISQCKCCPPPPSTPYGLSLTLHLSVSSCRSLTFCVRPLKWSSTAAPQADGELN